MRRVLALLLLAALAACTRTTGTPAAAGARHPWTHPGVLRLAGSFDPDTLNPLVGDFQVDVDLAMFWAGFLFRYDDRDRLVPDLATAVPTLENGGISRDGRTIVYHLRRGVTWQDGAPFDASDVVFSWRAVMNPRNNVSTRIGYDDVERIDVRDPYTIAVRLKRPYAPFVATFFSMSGTVYPVLPKHLLARYPDLNRVPYNSAPIGTGPFRVQEWHRGQTLRMVANPRYWRGAPKLKEVAYQIVPDDNTLLTLMKSHGADLWYEAPPSLSREASSISGTHPVLTPFTQYAQIGFNLERPVMRELAVRRALAYATDRAKIISSVTFGVDVPGEGDQPAFSWAHDARLAPIPYDPERARMTLDAAGWKPGSGGIRVKDGRPLRVEIATTTGSATGSRAAVLLQSAWRAIGVDAQVKTYASALMFASYGAGGIVQSGKYDAAFFSWVNGVDPDDSFLFMCDQFPPAGQNSWRFCDPEVDREERIALTHYDRATRKKAYDRIQEILVDRVPFVTLWFTRHLDIVSDDLRGYRPAHAVSTFWNPWDYQI